jgi:hypothetical protein
MNADAAAPEEARRPRTWIPPPAPYTAALLLGWWLDRNVLPPSTYAKLVFPVFFTEPGFPVLLLVPNYTKAQHSPDQRRKQQRPARMNVRSVPASSTSPRPTKSPPWPLLTSPQSQGSGFERGVQRRDRCGICLPESARLGKHRSCAKWSGPVSARSLQAQAASDMALLATGTTPRAQQ